MHSIANEYLSAGKYVNSDHPEVEEFAFEQTKREISAKGKVIALYYAVRDGFWYDPYRLDFSHEAMRASHLLGRDHGYCVEKSSLFAASCRVLGIPSRLGFSRVRNHVGTEKLEEMLKTDVLVFHGYSEILLEGNWIKVTPVFNKELCEKLNVEPLEFDGESDAIFQSYDRKGGKFMEYLHDYGSFPDIP